MADRRDRIETMLKELIQDLEACHEYYCKLNCGTILKGHSPRCDKLRGEFGFQAHKPASADDIKKS